MIITVCEKCKRFLKEDETLYPITVKEGYGFISQMQVCNTCYESLSALEDQLLLEEV